MTSDGRYGFPELDEALRVPLARFPQAGRKKLEGLVAELSGLWRTAEWDAFRDAQGTIYLKVTLDLGERPFRLYLHPDEETLQFEAPVLLDFPESASTFVLTELCGANTMLSFRLDQQPKQVLNAWRRDTLTAFSEQHTFLMPYLVAKVRKADAELAGYLGQIQCPESGSGQLS